MGKDVAANRHPTHERPKLNGTLLVDTFDVIAPFYELTDEPAFHELTEYLVGLSCRDQEDEPVAQNRSRHAGDAGDVLVERPRPEPAPAAQHEESRDQDRSG